MLLRSKPYFYLISENSKTKHENHATARVPLAAYPDSELFLMRNQQRRPLS